MSVPAFADYASAQDWMDRKAKEYGTKRAFMASPEYREAYPQVRALYDAEKAGGDAKRMQDMTDAGLKVGDTVTTFVGNGFLGGEARTGKIVMRGGTPTVQLDGEMAVERNGRIAYVKSLPWDRRWGKPSEQAATPPAKQGQTTTGATDEGLQGQGQGRRQEVTAQQAGETRPAPADVSNAVPAIDASPGRVEQRANSQKNETAAKLQARKERKAKVERDDKTIELRKRLSVLRSLRECIG